ncbi:MAG: NH(3)-dependent synthetase [Bacteroidetes bacterium]|nr:NH(3)-dependent synthetase [Bacteroidota bacterium]
MNNGFLKIATAIPRVQVADCSYNTICIKKLIEQASRQNVQIVCFPELSITAYTCADLFQQQLLVEEAEKSLARLVEETKQLNIVSIVGLPVRVGSGLFNCAVVFGSGRIYAVVPKTHLPNYNEFYEKRWFVSAKDAVVDTITLAGQSVPFGIHLLIGSGNFHFSIELCEDLWVTVPPSSLHALMGAQLIFNLSASNEIIAKNDYLISLIAQQSARCIAGYVYAGAGFGESSQDVVFAGKGIVAENGRVLSMADRFSFDEQLLVSEIDVDLLTNERQHNSGFSQDGTAIFSSLPEYRLIECPIPAVDTFALTRTVSPTPFIPSGIELDKRCEEIFSIQIGGLAKRFMHTQSKTAVIGISGGLDSTLALLVTALTFDKLSIPRTNILGITMPGFGTTGRTYNNAIDLMNSLGVTIREIDITAASLQHFNDIGHSEDIHDVTYENTQARERTQILMNIANKEGGLVIGTGDLSELAMGWCTYNGDHMSMYGVNSGVPKTLIRYLVSWVANHKVGGKSADTLRDILDTPVSPELLPTDTNGDIAQKTEDIIGPYELHDFYLYYMVRYGFSPSKIFYLAQHAFAGKYADEVIRKWLKIFIRRFFSQQFKRSCLPDGPKVGSINLSPRGDWRMPSDAVASLWLKDLDEL